MSKSTIRLPESAISGGRVGTARIREQIAGATARLETNDMPRLEQPIQRMLGGAQSNTRRAGTPAHTAASAKHRANTGIGEKPAAGNRETPLGGHDATHAYATSIASGTGRSVESVLAELGAAPKYSPVERMQQLGRLGTGRMNKTEAAYAEQLAARLHIGEILWFRFEGHKLRLADNTFYTPDFAVIVAGGALEFHEVKGHWTDKARAKTKVAAAQYPHRFFAIQRDGRHGWRIEDLTSRSW